MELSARDSIFALKLRVAQLTPVDKMVRKSTQMEIYKAYWDLLIAYLN